MKYQHQIWSKPVRSHLVVQEDEVHLYEGEGHPGGRRQRQQHVVTFGVTLHLEVLSELEPRVDHAADTKRWNTQRVLCCCTEYTSTKIYLLPSLYTFPPTHGRCRG